MRVATKAAVANEPPLKFVRADAAAIPSHLAASYLARIAYTNTEGKGAHRPESAWDAYQKSLAYERLPAKEPVGQGRSR
jgi:hypothetical protein